MTLSCHSISFLLESDVDSFVEVKKVSSKQTSNPPSCACCVIDEAPLDLTSKIKISADDDPGERLVIRGIVYKSDGKTPAPNVVMYFYHTDSTGRYAKRGTEDRDSFAWWHGFHRGWLKTDEQGRYEIETIRPAPYPNGNEPAHIHTIIEAPSQKSCYSVADYVFTDDPLLKPAFWQNTDRWWKSLGIGESSDYGGVKLTRNTDGVWEGRRNITLFEEFDQPQPDSGRNIGEQNPAFEPQHVWGPDKGSRACPMCKYGFLPGVLFWLNSDTDWDNAAKFARRLDDESEKRGDKRFKAYFIYMNPQHEPLAEVEKKLTDFARKLNLKHIAVTYVPSPDDAKTAKLNEINPSVKNTVIVFKKRRVFDKFVNFEPSEKNLNLLMAAVNRAEKSTPPKVTRPVYQNPLELSASGFVLTKVKVNKKEALALIDTGSPESIELSSAFARQLSTSNGRIETLSIGGYMRQNLPFKIAGEHFTAIAKRANIPVDLILGWQFLSQQYFVLDYPNRYLQISGGVIEKGESKMSFNYRNVNSVPIIDGSFDQAKFNLLLNTGTSLSQIDSGFTNLSPDKKTTKEINIEGYRLTLNWQVKNLRNFNQAVRYEAVIGNNFLMQYAVYFDKKNKIIFLN